MYVFLGINYTEKRNVVGVEHGALFLKAALDRLKLFTYLQNDNDGEKIQTIFTRITGDGVYYIGNIENFIRNSMPVSPVFSQYYDDNHTMERGIVKLQKNNSIYNNFVRTISESTKNLKTPKQQSLIAYYMDKIDSKFITMKKAHTVNFACVFLNLFLVFVLFWKVHIFLCVVQIANVTPNLRLHDFRMCMFDFSKNKPMNEVSLNVKFTF